MRDGLGDARPSLPAAVVGRVQAAVHFLIRISPDLPLIGMLAVSFQH